MKYKEYVMYNNDNGKLYTKDWNGLKKWLEDKLWNLHTEEKHFREINRERFKTLKEKSINNLNEEEYQLLEECHKWEQALGKIVFINGALSLFFEPYGKNNSIGLKVYKERGWKEINGKIIKKVGT